MSDQYILCIGIDEQTTSKLTNYFAYRFTIKSVHTAKELLKSVSNYKPSLIFLNNSLPDFSNTQELCIAIRSCIDIETVPIIILSDKENQKEKIILFQAALIDGYFTFPLNIEELAAYSNVFLERHSLQEQLEEKNKLLSQISITDDLMQIYNRRYLMKCFEDELEKIRRYNYPLSALMIDLDFFKKVNDQYGHIHGDFTLRELAKILKKNVRNIDIICRYGGEEILVLLPHISLNGAKITAERLRTKVKAHNFGSNDFALKLTISIGLVSFDGKSEINIDSAIRALDKQLYKAKNSGRDQICAISYSPA